MTSSTDPVGTRSGRESARPGENVTGLTNVGGEMAENVWSCSKRSHRDSVVRLFWGRQAQRADEIFVKGTEAHARAMGVQLIRVGGFEEPG